ncbi:MAG TPA: SRPBCC domain-containing protein [Bauldia sp.]|nr:SRPBCC domain-containing protein [Bauldia sp.]
MADTIEANGATAVSEGRTDRTLVIERVFRAPPEKVFAAWTDPVIFSRWFGPEGFAIREHSLDATVGGAWRAVMEPQSGKAVAASGVYRQIAPPRRLVMTWAWDQEDGRRGHETLLDLTFEPDPAGTRMRLVQSLFQDKDVRDGHNGGWSSAFNKLDRLLATV